MKTLIRSTFAVAIGLLSLFSLELKAQTSLMKPELYGFYGYGFADRINAAYGYFRITDSPIYGGSIAMPLPGKGQGFQIELSYQRQDTKIESYDSDPLNGIPGNGYKWNMSMNYFQLNAIYNIVKVEKQRAIPYIGIGAGALYASVKDAAVQDDWKFAYNIKAGVKIRVNDVIGIRLQGQLYSPVQGGGIMFGVGTGGASVGVGTYSSIYQWGLTGGLIFYLKK